MPGFKTYDARTIDEFAATAADSFVRSYDVMLFDVPTPIGIRPVLQIAAWNTERKNGNSPVDTYALQLEHKIIPRSYKEIGIDTEILLTKADKIKIALLKIGQTADEIYTNLLIKKFNGNFVILPEQRFSQNNYSKTHPRWEFAGTFDNFGMDYKISELFPVPKERYDEEICSIFAKKTNQKVRRIIKEMREKQRQPEKKAVIYIEHDDIRHNRIMDWIRNLASTGSRYRENSKISKMVVLEKNPLLLAPPKKNDEKKKRGNCKNNDSAPKVIYLGAEKPFVIQKVIGYDILGRDVLPKEDQQTVEFRG